nr:hypothetical protein [Bacilli bacterium]
MVVVVYLVIHVVINVDIFRKKATVSLPAIGAYRVFVTTLAVHFLTDILWGVFDANKWTIALYADTVAYFILMGSTILAWTRYIVKYLKEKSWIGKTILYVGNAFFLAEIVLLIVNIFVPILFEVDMQTGAYQPYKARNIML